MSLLHGVFESETIPVSLHPGYKASRISRMEEFSSRFPSLTTPLHFTPYPLFDEFIMVYTLPYGNARIMTVLIAALLVTAAPAPVAEVTAGGIEVCLFLSVI